VTLVLADFGVPLLDIHRVSAGVRGVNKQERHCKISRTISYVSNVYDLHQ